MQTDNWSFTIMLVTVSRSETFENSEVIMLAGRAPKKYCTYEIDLRHLAGSSFHSINLLIPDVLSEITFYSDNLIE